MIDPENLKKLQSIINEIAARPDGERLLALVIGTMEKIQFSSLELLHANQNFVISFVSKRTGLSAQSNKMWLLGNYNEDEIAHLLHAMDEANEALKTAVLGIKEQKNPVKDENIAVDLGEGKDKTVTAIRKFREDGGIDLKFIN